MNRYNTEGWEVGVEETNRTVLSPLQVPREAEHVSVCVCVREVWPGGQPWPG